MLNHPVNDGPEVKFEAGFTPGNIPEYGVAQNYREVFTASSALCKELAAANDDDISDVPACVKTMRVKSLFHCVGRFVGLTNHTSMQRFFESESVRYEKDAGVIHSKKYRGYLRGLHLPGARTLENINRLTGRNWNFELHQLLWASLDTTVMLEPVEVLLNYLFHQSVQRFGLALYQGMLRGQHADVVHYCDMMLEIPGLPPLTALILLLRAAHETQNQSAASVLANYLAWKLMMVGEELQQREVASLFFRFAIRHLFPLAPQWNVDISACEMARKSMLLNLLPFFSHARTSNQRLDQGEREQIMFLWVHEAWGSMAADALSLRFLKDGDASAGAAAEDNSRRLALKNLASIVSKKTGRSPLVMSRDYLNPDLNFRVLANHRPKELKELLSQLAGA